MINGFAKFCVLYLAPLVMLTAFLLSLFALLSPSVMLHDQVALLTVTPSTALTNPQGSAGDGPSVFMGALGSCSRSSFDAAVNCTVTSISPVYDTSVLPESASSNILSAPPSTAPTFIAVAISFSFLFMIMFILVSFRHLMSGKFAEKLDSAMVHQITAWIGVFGFMVGLTAFLIVRMWFEKAIDDFNKAIIAQGDKGPHLIASAGNGFIMVWVAYAFYAIPLIASLAKINVQATAGKGV
ncbi:hypothetical protein FIBSPDRAFT_1037748 [Athelia psychrophila]|uniref:Uncharacterized protein n=1 Tax=Athelia psychrophila TaxID=1759441 RepID=A0A166U4A1_9AGAM|nr:hypothetical protein FIBSPDRAFT_1037748 [Fibularhizoctonia sp. CBS 109695]